MSRQRTFPIIIATAATLLLATMSFASDWSRWLGPDQNGVSPETGVFGSAPELKVSWTQSLGKAYSGIAVASGRAITMFADGDSDFLIAFDAGEGEELWRYRIDDTFPKVGGADGGQLSMPAIDGGRVYGLGAKGQLFAVRAKDGSEVWTVRIDEKFGARQPRFGFTTSPLIVGGLLFVQAGGADGKSMLALDKKTGEKKWSVGDEKVGYQSPVLVELAGKKQIVAVTNESVTGLRPADGSVLWRHEHGLVERDGWSTPILIGDDAFVLTAQAESAAFRLSANDDGFEVAELWRGTNLKQAFAMPVLHEDHLYGYDGDFLTCVAAATGERAWKDRQNGSGLVLVDGHLVIFATDGAVVVAKASPEGFEETTRVQVAKDGSFTFPSFADGGIYVRNLTEIARVDVAESR